MSTKNRLTEYKHSWAGSKCAKKKPTGQSPILRRSVCIKSNYCSVCVNAATCRTLEKTTEYSTRKTHQTS